MRRDKSAQQRQRHPVLAPQREQVLDARRLLFDVLQTCGYVAECNLKVPDIGHIQSRGLDPEFRMFPVGQHAAGAADGVRTIARASAIGGANVKRHPGHNEVSPGVIAGDAEEAGRRGEGRCAGHGVSGR